MLNDVDTDKLKDFIKAIALENAISHGGKPSFDAVVKKFIASKPEFRPRVKKVIPLIREIVDEVSGLDISQQKGLFDDLVSLLPPRVEKRVEEHVLPPLPKAVKGNVVTRFAPNPDFVLHLGSLRPLVLSYEYAKMYDGKFILRFEDTDPRTKRPKMVYYDMILKDLSWLGASPDEVYYQSDRLDLYYEIAKVLISNGQAYVCTCSRTEFPNYVRVGKACPHRGNGVEENLRLFETMLVSGFEEGGAVVRLKTDLNHPNPSIRDWPLLRIIDTDKFPHPRVGSKYRVWPLYNFSVAIDDHYMGVTHILRGEEHRVNEEKQRYIYRYMGWSIPYSIHHGRLAIPTGILSKSKILKGIKDGVFKGYDDPRLATLVALRRRGFHPTALKNIILSVGTKSTKAVIDWSLIAAENRKIIDPLANRYYAVRNPFVVMFSLDSPISVKIRKHPDYLDRGYREFLVKPDNDVCSLYVDFSDSEFLREEADIRLLHLGNYRVKKVDVPFAELEYVDNDVKKATKFRYPFVHWVYPMAGVKASFVYPEREFEGFIESTISGESVDTWVQLERLGYFRIEYLDDDFVKVIFTHD